MIKKNIGQVLKRRTPSIIFTIHRTTCERVTEHKYAGVERVAATTRQAAAAVMTLSRHEHGARPVKPCLWARLLSRSVLPSSPNTGSTRLRVIFGLEKEPPVRS